MQVLRAESHCMKSCGRKAKRVNDGFLFAQDFFSIGTKGWAESIAVRLGGRKEV
jgi:hypothetical protein